MGITIYQKENSAPIRGVLFDMDGLVLDTEKLYARFWTEACHVLGYPMTREQALGMRSLNHAAGQEKLISYFGPEISYDLVRAKRIELMDAFIEEYGVDPMPGIYELMENLNHRGIPTAITSSSPMERILRYLTPLGLTNRFTYLISGYDVPHGKPEPDIYLHGAAKLSLRTEECLALEDSPAGILSAYRAGCRAVMIPDQDHPDENTIPLLFAKADSLTDIISLLG